MNEYPTDLEDLVLTGEFKLATSPRLSFVCRDTQKPNNHLCRVVASPTAIWIQKMSGISSTPKSEVLIKKEVKLDPEKWHKVTIEICGDTLIAKIDDHVIEAKNDRFKDHKGLVVMNSSKEGAQFRNVAVWSATPKK